ncbi:hypothetical protein [Streptomyces sp. NPDC088757]|uniref:hypothetical protein n=1 Tax=Streptomyces sp. NPDC088757 TaxID=3365889 RepID=UPI0037F8084D
MTLDEGARSAGLTPGGSTSAVSDPSAGGESLHTESEHDAFERAEFLSGVVGNGIPFVYAPHGNINTGSVHGGQRVHNGSVRKERGTRRSRVREGPIPEAEVRAAAFGFARPGWFGEALAKMERGPLFLVGRPGSGRRTAALNLLRVSCGKGAPLRALDSVTELDRWQPADPPARGYLMDGLFPTRFLGPGVLGHVHSLLEKAGARMVIVLPDDTALLRSLEQDLHIRPTECVPPSPAMVFGSRFEAMVPDQRERERLLAALEHGRRLGDLLVPELVPAEVVELVTAIVAADGDPDALGGVEARLSYRAEKEVPELMRKLRDDPDALAFLLSACVYEGLDHRLVTEEAGRLLKLSEGRLAAVLHGTDSQGAEKADRPNPDFVFRRSLSELLHAVHAVRQEPEILTTGSYAHSVQAVTFVRHRQAETVLRHVWCEYGRLSELLVDWLREVSNSDGLAESVGRFMGRAASWGGGRRALEHVQALADSERATGWRIAAHALGIAAEDPVLVSEVRYRLQRWSLTVSPRLRTTVAYACGSEFGISRPDVALRLLHTLLLGARDHRGGRRSGDDGGVLSAVRMATLELFRAGNEDKVFDRVVEWLDAEQSDTDQVLSLYVQLLRSPEWFVRKLAGWEPESERIVEVIRLALNTESSFGMACSALLHWADWGQWDETMSRAVENLFTALSGSVRSGEFRLFVEVDGAGSDGWAGLGTARAALGRWRAGRQGEAA